MSDKVKIYSDAAKVLREDDDAIWIEKRGIMVNNLVEWIRKNCDGEYEIDVVDYPNYIQIQTVIDDICFFSQHTSKEFKRIAKEFGIDY